MYTERGYPGALIGGYINERRGSREVPGPEAEIKKRVLRFFKGVNKSLIDKPQIVGAFTVTVTAPEVMNVPLNVKTLTAESNGTPLAIYEIETNSSGSVERERYILKGQQIRHNMIEQFELTVFERHGELSSLYFGLPENLSISVGVRDLRSGRSADIEKMFGIKLPEVPNKVFGIDRKS